MTLRTVSSIALAGALIAAPSALGAPSVSMRATADAFASTTIVVSAPPGSSATRATVLVSQGGRRTAREIPLRKGSGGVRFPVRGGGELTITATVEDVRRTVRLQPRLPALSGGESGRAVRYLSRRLRTLRFVVSGGEVFDERLRQSVWAFQKAYDLPRTGTVDAAMWRRLGTARVIAPRRRTPGRHIEVDRRRQILMVVNGGRVEGILPVSTGRSGNTPLGEFRIQRKDPFTRTWLGPAILYRTLTYHQGRFAIHGYKSVPPFPASSGCTRIPNALADWLYERSVVSETVLNYESPAPVRKT